MNAKIFLTIDNRVKDIPYPPSNDKGSQNFGFKSYKGNTSRISKISEAKGFSGIISLLTAINDEISPFFSIGCEKIIEAQYSSFYARGYIEFALNYGPMLVDMLQYMNLFGKFANESSEYVKNKNFSFNWEIAQAFFKKIDKTGYSCTIWVHVFGFSNRQDAVAAYNEATEFLASFFRSIVKPTGDFLAIY